MSRILKQTVCRGIQGSLSCLRPWCMEQDLANTGDFKSRVEDTGPCKIEGE
ncbi:hypothetical protein Plhal304r1_c003g0013521 [Plasmopara halstedii]